MSRIVSFLRAIAVGIGTTIAIFLACAAAGEYFVPWLSPGWRMDDPLFGGMAWGVVLGIPGGMVAGIVTYRRARKRAQMRRVASYVASSVKPMSKE